MSLLPLAYCTNVHAGADYGAMRANLQRHALAVKRRYAPQEPMGVGLWLAAQAAREVLAGGQTAELRDWLAEQGLLPFTLNGFPYGDFHQPVVKHRVYLPAWWQRERLDYTLDLVRLLDAILPEGVAGSISTVPIGWGTPTPDDARWSAAAGHLLELAETLARLEDETGRRIVVALEPEPGCLLQRSDDVREFFHRWLFVGGRLERARRYLTVCHDTCHAAVMGEDQAAVLAAYRRWEIGVGKVQVSSAIIVDWDPLGANERVAAFEQLSAFAEDRYLHQTQAITGGATGPFFEDLPGALAATNDPAQLAGRWGIHFHVPVYLERFGLLGTSQADIRRCLQSVAEHADTEHLEVETYAWTVLPDALRQPTLADGIAQELNWTRNLLAGTKAE